MTDKTIQLRALTADERDAARAAAIDRVKRHIGSRPVRADFQSDHYSPYPIWLTRTASAGAIVALLAAFVASAIRLNHIGYSTFMESVPDSRSAAAAAVAIVVLAEAAVIVFSLMLSTLGTTPTARRLLLLSMALSTAVAFVGNIELAQPKTLFAWLEAVAPPLLTLSLSYVLKIVALDSIAERRRVEQVYQEAVKAWEVSSREPERYPRFGQVYATALREMLMAANRKGQGATDRKEHMQKMGGQEWRALVENELRQDNWFEEGAKDVAPVALPVAAVEVVDQPEAVPLVTTNGNGRHLETV